MPEPMRVLMVGAGGVGDAAARIAVERDFFEAWVVADYDLGRAEHTVAAATGRRTGEERFTAAQVDASDADAVAALAREVRATHVFNAVDPRFVMPIFSGALAADADYLDMAMSLSVRHPDRPYEQVGVKLGDEQFARAGEWESAGRLALLGIGVEPGLSDVFARYAADELFDHIDELGTRDGANLVIRDDDGNEVFAPGFSMWTIIEECLNPPVVWERERAGGDLEKGFFTLPPFSEPEVFEFPDGIGPVECVHVEHEEVLLMPRWVDADRVTFKYGLGEEMITILKTLHTLGLDSTEPVTVKGVQVSPRDVVAACLPDPATIGPRMEGKTCAGLFVTGTGKDGAPRSTYLYHVVDNADSMRDYGAQCVVWQTAINPVVALELLADGTWSGTGVLGPEALPPKPFLDLLAAPKPEGYGSPLGKWQGPRRTMTLSQERILATAIPGPRSQELQARKVAAVSAGVGTTLPVYVEQAGGGILRDVDGNQLIDFGSGIAVTTVGNAAPRVVEAVQRQVADFTHTCFMVTPYEEYIQVCEKLAELTPGQPREALGALQLRRRGGGERGQGRAPPHRSRRRRRLRPRLPRAYEPDDGADREEHALQARLRALRRRDLPRADGLPLPLAGRGRGLRRRGVRRLRRRPSTRRWARTTARPSSIEPIQGEGGFIVPPPGWLPRVADWCRDNGILFIADEIQTGFARTGDWFACDHEGVVPDLVTTAKGMAGGLPLAAVTGRAEVMDSVHVGGLGGTYGGNPVACAAALAAIETMEAEDLPARARAIEAAFVPRLRAIADRHPDRVGEIRGRGAMLAVELVSDGPGRTPDAALAGAVHRACSAQGLVTLTCGTFGNVFRFLPPLAIGDDLLSEGLDIFEAAFDDAPPAGKVE